MLIVRDGWLAQHQLFGLPHIHSVSYSNIAQLEFKISQTCQSHLKHELLTLRYITVINDQRCLFHRLIASFFRRGILLTQISSTYKSPLSEMATLMTSTYLLWEWQCWQYCKKLKSIILEDYPAHPNRKPLQQRRQLWNRQDRNITVIILSTNP